ncbi:hypothetical protein ACFL54_09380, partial [Planctomycetota bacterium]
GHGTSQSAAMASGLAAEMIIMNKMQHDTDNTIPELNPLDIVELLEITADDIGLPQTQQGHGRINVWKALLSAANGGVAIENSNGNWNIDSTPSKKINHTKTRWYGFKIYVRGTTPIIDGSLSIFSANDFAVYYNIIDGSFSNIRPLNDTSNLNTFFGGPSLIDNLFLEAVPPKPITSARGQLPWGVSSLSGLLIDPRFVSKFSADKEFISNKEIIIGRSSLQSLDDIFYRIKLTEEDFVNLRRNDVSPPGGGVVYNGPNLSFDNYIFTLKIPSVFAEAFIDPLAPDEIIVTLNLETLDDLEPIGNQSINIVANTGLPQNATTDDLGGVGISFPRYGITSFTITIPFNSGREIMTLKIPAPPQ